MKRLICLLTGLLLAAPAGADSLQEVMAILGRHAVVRADYTQRKHIVGRKRDFLSGGALVFAQRQGVLLEMSTPATSQLVMTATRIVLRTPHKVTRINVAQSPLGPTASVFGQLASGDRQLLQTFAVTSLTMRDGVWQLQLTPRSARLKSALASLQLGGDDFLRTIALNDSRGGQVALQLEHHQILPDALTADELELFRLAQ